MTEDRRKRAERIFDLAKAKMRKTWPDLAAGKVETPALLAALLDIAVDLEQRCEEMAKRLEASESPWEVVTP